MLKSLIAGSAIAAALLVPMPTLAKSPDGIQTPLPAPALRASVSEAELKQFVEQFIDVVPKIQVVLVEANEESADAIATSELTTEEFDRILQSQQSGEDLSAAGLSSEKTAEFERLSTKLSDIQRQTMLEVMQVAQEEGIQIRTVQRIFTAVRDDPQLQSQLQQIIIDVIVENSEQPQ